LKPNTFLAAFSCVALLITSQLSAADPVYVQHENVVYGDVHGIGLLMDIFVPTGDRNGLGIVDVASGAWHSDRGKIRDHKLARVYDIFCRKGYTVFAVRPGSVSRFSALDMLDNLKRGIVWVKQQAGEYEVDPARLGLTGASAGGHLACLASVAPNREDNDSTVCATAVFFPPTDFLDWDGAAVDPRSTGRLSELMGRLVFTSGVSDLSESQIQDGLTQISPARQVSSQCPPFLLIHGDADPLVPLQQSQAMLAALQKAQVPAELIVKPGGAHPWPTIYEEVQVIGDWFDRQLKTESQEQSAGE
jgi:acetyl esterase/lipase